MTADIATQRPSRHKLCAAYRALVDRGVLSPDPAQEEASALLGAIASRLERRKAFRPQKLFARRKPVVGAYLWGEVGRGKTMLMDLMFEHTDLAGKRRVHFHEFMDEIHREIAVFRVRSADDNSRRDPIPFVTRSIVAETRLLCLDEFHVDDIANAMLLGRLFEALFAGGVTLIATSNTPPDGLYRNGLNRQLVLPFISLLKQKTHVFELKSGHDYRHRKLFGEQVFCFGPHETTRPALDAIWQSLTGGQDGEAGEVPCLGRTIAVPQQAMGVARFSFADLCEAPLGARDYLRLAECFHSFIIDAIPVLDRSRSDAARRFVLLIDTLYDRGAILAAAFATPLERLGGDGATAFDLRRTVSRLIEMQSAEYLAEKA